MLFYFLLNNIFEKYYYINIYSITILIFNLKNMISSHLWEYVIIQLQDLASQYINNPEMYNYIWNIIGTIERNKYESNFDDLFNGFIQELENNYWIYLDLDKNNYPYKDKFNERMYGSWEMPANMYRGIDHRGNMFYWHEPISMKNNNN